MPYTFQDHTHRFAAWCAATAARASKNCRFSVEVGVRLIEATDLQNWGRGWDRLPDTAQFDKKHAELRESVVEKACQSHGITGVFTHGVAAKLINCYLKPIYVCGALPQDTAARDKLAAFHPPIDRVLLNGIVDVESEPRRARWRKWRDQGWSSFDSPTYDEVIRGIRELVAQNGLWSIEEYWIGHQLS